MIECPNCGKSVRNGFAHCRFCGSEMNGERLGDFTTDMLNVFKIEDEYLYLFSEKGNQVIIRQVQLMSWQALLRRENTLGSSGTGRQM